ncbi:MAG TPA: ribosome recycling factor [Acholeplasmataceae bacterium]|nr:ribosome recycling factor [Acholeplasmataceae bacterium]
MPEMILLDGEERMQGAIEALKREMSLIRTGRANPSVLNGVMVSYYGTMTPINQIASISAPEAQQLLVKPYDKSALNDIVKAIQTADLNLNPVSDGTVIRINFPALTTETRKQLSKSVKAIAENYKVNIRNIRRDLIDQFKKMEKNSDISEDDLHRYSDDAQKLTDTYTEKVDLAAKEKEELIMEI